MCADQNAARKKRNLLDQQGMAEKIINGDLLVAPNQNLTIMSKDMDEPSSIFISDMIRSESLNQINSCNDDTNDNFPGY